MPREYDPLTNQYIEVDEDAGILSTIGAGASRPFQQLRAGAYQAAGEGQVAQDIMANQEAEEQASGALTRPIAATVGQGISEAAIAAPALFAGGPAGQIAAEVAIQNMFYGSLEERGLRTGLAVLGPAAMPAGRFISSQAARAVPRSISIPTQVRGMLDESKAYMDSFKKSPGGQAAVGRSAGAAEAPQTGRPGELYLDEAEEIFPSMSDAQRSLVGGDDSAANRMKLRRDENQFAGQQARLQQEEEFGRFFMNEIAPPGANITRDFTKQGIRDSLDDVGEAMGEIENAMPDMAVPDEVVQMARDMAADRPEGQFGTIADQMGGSFKNAQQQIRRQIDRFDRAQMYDARDALMNLKSELDEALQLPPEYKELQRKYAIGMAALDNEVVLGGGGAFNVKSLVNRISKNYKPFRHGADDSTFGRALRTMQTLQQKQTAGSPTAEKLVGNMLGGGAGGLIGMGLLGL